MDKETVVFFLDYANINRAAREKRFRLNYQDLLNYVGEGRCLLDARCYVPINPRNEHRLDAAIEELWRSGYIVTTKLGTVAGGTYKCNFDVEITMDVLKVVYQAKPDIIVLASGDSDFVSLIQEVRKSGVRVEVAAFEETAGADILLKSSGYIDMAVYYDAYLAAQSDEPGEDRIEEQYKNLIQSQNGEPGKDAITEHTQDLLQSHESDLDKVNIPIEELDTEIQVSAPDIIDELEM